MTTVEPIILSGTAETGRRFVQFWTLKERVAGRDVPFCRVEFNDGPDYAPDWLRIKHGCPPDWVAAVLQLFPTFYAGGTIPATHTVTWVFGNPTFHPVTPDGQLELTETQHGKHE